MDEALRMFDKGTAAGRALIRVEKWSLRIHDRDSDRHRWAMATAAALLAGEEPPRFPSHYRGVHETRVDTIRRLLEEG